MTEVSNINGDVRQPHHHDSSIKHVSGEAIYIDDITMPKNGLVVLIGQSPHAHAKIRNIDLSSVIEAPGVVAVMTSKDIPGINDCGPVVNDDPIFAETEVCYVGQSVFAVVATDIKSARSAISAAKIDYEPLPSILTIDEAMEKQSFLGSPAEMIRGNPKQVLANVPHKLSGRLRVGGQEHFYLEGQAALAIPSEDGDMCLFCSTQHPSEVQHKVAAMLGIANHSVTVETRRMGGAFGGKESQGNLPALTAALAAFITGQSAKTIYDRDDDFMLTGKRHDFRIDYTVGFDSDGRIQAVEFDHALRCGMSWDLSAAIASRAMCHADNAYYIKNVRIKSFCCKTHTQSNTAFRGFGGPQGMLGIERVIDAVAHFLGLDPLLVRKRNFYPSRSASKLGVTPYGQIVEDCIIHEIVNELVESSDYQKRRKNIDDFNCHNKYQKRGIALTPVKFGISFNTTYLNQAGSLVHVYNDGSVHLNHGGTEMGQGLNTKIAQIVAHEFQIDIDNVKITATTTGKVPNTSATAASSGTDLNGMAAMRAARAIKDRIIEFLALEYQTEINNVHFANGMVHIGNEAISFVEAVKHAYRGRISLSSTGFYATPKLKWDPLRLSGRPFYYFVYGAAVSEVLVDLLTGESRILRSDLLHDAGKSLNPVIDKGQVEGGFMQGVGWLTTEELVWNNEGRLMTHSPSSYKIPTCSDRPLDWRVKLYAHGENNEETIHKSKAVGEPPLMLAISVWLALSNALAGIDNSKYPFLDTPATPERLLLAAQKLGARFV